MANSIQLEKPYLRLGKFNLLFYLPICIALFCYVIYRAYSLSLTIDEAATYVTFVPMGFMDIISYKITSANNHILNTVLIKAFSSILGNSELVLRLPNVLAYILYLYVSYRIADRMQNRYLAIVTFLLLNFNPYLLDFFSIARGYGLAVAFVLASVDATLDYVKTEKKVHMLASFLFASLAVLSNFSILIFFTSLIIVYNYLWLSKGTTIQTLFTKNLPVFGIVTLMTIILFEPIRRLIKYNGLYFGGTIGFWHDTVGSLIQLSFYGKWYANSLLMPANLFVTIALIAMIVLFIKGSYRKAKTNSFLSFNIAFLLLVLPCLTSLCQHVTLKTPFMADRTGLFFIPLFFCSLVFFFNCVKQNIITYGILGLLTIAFTANTLYAMNTRYFVSWVFDSQTKEALADIAKSSNMKGNKRATMGITQLYEASVTYYKDRMKLDSLQIEIVSNSNKKQCDYYYLMNSELKQIRSMIDDRMIVKKYTQSDAVLFSYQ